MSDGKRRIRSKGHVSDRHARRIELIAYLYCESSQTTEARIVRELGLNAGTVSEDLGIAKDRGLVVEKRHFHSECMFDPARLQQLKLTPHSSRLKAHLRKTSKQLQEIFVFDSAGDALGERAFPARLTQMARNAAPIIRDFCQRAACVGVAWGTTLGAVVDALIAQNTSSSKGTPQVQFVPICGEPVGARKRVNSATSLALALDQAVNGGQNNSYSLAGVPALIPRQFCSESEAQVIRRFFQTATDYGKIFGIAEPHRGDDSDNKPLITRLEMILTSVGTSREHWRMCGVDLRQEAGELTEAEFSNLAYGDLGGMLLPRDGLDVVETRKLEGIREQWTGMGQQEYVRVAEACCSGGVPGVVVVAIAANKAEALYQAIKWNLVNYIVCDYDLAQALAQVSGAPGLQTETKSFLNPA